MTDRFWKRAHIAALSLIALPLLVAGECEDDPPTGSGNGDGDGLTVPSSWANTYRVETVETTSLERGPVAQVSIGVLCAGSDATQEFFSDEYDLSCTGTIDDAGADITCTAEREVFPGCTEMLTETFEATRDPSTGSITGTSTRTSTFEGECLRVGFKTTTVITATVLDTESPGCAAGLEDAVHPAWGGTWEISLQFVDCKTGKPLDGGVFEQLYCPGAPAASLLDIPDEPGRLPFPRGKDLETWGGFDSDDVDMFIAERIEQGTCQRAQSWRVLLHRVGETFTGSGEAFEYYSPNGGPCEEIDTHQCFTISAERLSTDTSACGIGARAHRPKKTP
jgi:hypothetical protein